MLVIDRRIGFALIVVAIAALFFFWPSSPPQIGPDEEAFRTLDALFTAITSRNHDRLNSSESRLRSLREQGRLPAQAADRIDAIIADARTGQWQPAAERLYEFIKGQRR